MKKGYIILENGLIFEGELFGYEKEVISELVFTTSMVGYNKLLTDPTNYGQAVLATFPMIGNYGTVTEDAESEGVWLSAYIVKELCDEPSNFRCEGKLEDYLIANKIVGIAGADTREITRVLRDNGTMNALITTNKDNVDFDAIKNYSVKGAVAAVSTKEIKTYKADGAKYNVAMIDYGEKRSTIEMLNSKGCDVTVYPYDTKAEDILAGNYSGLVLSNGPGDPKENTACIEEIKKLCGKLPIFGIGLGHQMFALALGADTAKLPYGHRGANQPVTMVETGRTYITSQNHGYAVVEGSPPEKLKVAFVNANDKTCEGIECACGSFSVQFVPEACGGPHDTSFLVDKFTKLM